MLLKVLTLSFFITYFFIKFINKVNNRLFRESYKHIRFTWLAELFTYFKNKQVKNFAQSMC